MPNQSWVTHTLGDYPQVKKNALIRFWNQFYTHLEQIQKEKWSDDLSKSKSYQYKDNVFRILHEEKVHLPLTEDKLHNIQMRIEDITLLFNEKSLFKTVPNLIKILIKNNDVSAKDYLKGRIIEDDHDQELLSEFGQYTIEALIVHVLSILFQNGEHLLIKLASLIEQLESSVRLQS